jgi:hypothetical protein
VQRERHPGKQNQRQRKERQVIVAHIHNVSAGLDASEEGIAQGLSLRRHQPPDVATGEAS